MKELAYFLSLIGINIPINENTSPIILFCCVILLLCTIILICFINILISVFVLYISENKKFLEKLPKNKLFLRIFNFYKMTRFYYIVIEVLFLLFNLGVIMWLCLRIIYGISI